MANVGRWTKDDPPNLLLAIDPGFSDTKDKTPYVGAALFQWGMMMWCAVVKAPTVISPFAQPNALVQKVCERARIARTRQHTGETPTILVVEKPEIYKRGRARPKDIMNLRTIYGAFMGGIDADFYVGPTPGAWKSSIDGEMFNEKVLAVANSGEKAVCVQSQSCGEGGLTSHCIDAMGLGFWVIGRMDSGGRML